MFFDSAFFRILEKSGGGPKTNCIWQNTSKKQLNVQFFVVFFGYRYLKDIYNVKTVYSLQRIPSQYLQRKILSAECY